MTALPKCFVPPFAVCSRWMIHRSERRSLFQSEFSLPSHPSLAFTPFWPLRSSVFRFNKLAIYSGTFINNPFLTLVPIIIASYAMGAFLLGRPLSIPPEGVELLKDPHPLTADYYRNLFRESWEIVWPFTVGAMVLSVVCSLLAYPVTLWLLRKRRRLKEIQ